MDLIVVTEGPQDELKRSVTLTNEQWMVLAQCVEAFSDTYRAKHSQTIATYVTRGQMTEAQAEAVHMNNLLHQLDRIRGVIL